MKQQNIYIKLLEYFTFVSFSFSIIIIAELNGNFYFYLLYKF